MRRLLLLSWPLALGSTLAACAANTPAPAAVPVAAAPVAAAPAAPVPGTPATTAVMARSGQPARNQCQAQPAQSLVGQPYTADVLERARAAAGADEARLLRPGMVVTKELKFGRLNVLLGTDGRVTSIYCG